MGTLIQRRIFFDLLKTTLLGLAGVSTLLVLVVAMIQVSRNGLDPLVVLKILPYLMPPLLTYTIPTCLLFACTVVYSGMSRNNEIVALKSTGIHAKRLFTPLLILAVVAGGFSVYLADAVIPMCNRAFRQALISDVKGTMYAYLRQRGELVQKGFPYELYVRNVAGEYLVDPIIKHRGPDGRYDMIAQASKATLDVVEANGEAPVVEIRLLDGVVVTDVENAVHFRDRTERMPMPDLFSQQNGKLEGMTFADCWERAESYRLQADSIGAHLQRLAARPQTPQLVDEAEKLDQEFIRCRRKARELDAEVQVRLAQAMAPLPFVLLGCPVSILFRRRDFLQAFFVCYLPIILGFYPAMILAYNVVKEGQETSMAIIWGPAVALALLSIPFVRHVVRH